MEPCILVEHHDGWTQIALNRPDRLNSFNDAMHVELRTALETAANDSQIRAVVLTGTGRGFCAGQDLEGRDPRTMDGPPDLSQTLTNLYNPLVTLIRTMDKPVICAVNGVAAGAGANIALACDIVLAADSAKFIQSFANVGLVPDAGGTWSLTRLIGPARAKALALTGQPITATRAADWGMIWQSVPVDDLMHTAADMAQKFANGPTIGYAKTKAAINAAATNSFADQLALEASSQYICGRTPDYREGVTAFLEKRKPKFTGQAE